MKPHAIVQKSWPLLTAISIVFGLQGKVQSLPSQSPELESDIPSLESFSENSFPLERLETQIERSNYVLGEGDILEIEVYEEENANGEYRIAVDGTIDLPLIGSQKVDGLTIVDLEALLEQEYSAFLRRPWVTVALVAPRPVAIAVSGEVTQPGTYTVNIEQEQRFPKVSQVLQLAGGITHAANIREVRIRRAGENRELSVDLWKLIREGELSQDVTLRDGDTIFVPTADEIDPIETRQLADASFAAQEAESIEVNIVGEVSRPGTHIIESDGMNSLPTVTRAIEAAGGITHASDIRNIKVRRITRAGSEQIIQVNLWQLLQSGDAASNAVLQAGDTIIIPEADKLAPEEADALARASFSPETIQVNIVGEVESPGIVQVPANTPLNQALFAAGGFNDRAVRESVELVRLNPNGTVFTQDVEIDFTSGISETNNPLLQQNDIIVVKPSRAANVSDNSSVLDTILSPFISIIRAITWF